MTQVSWSVMPHPNSLLAMYGDKLLVGRLGDHEMDMVIYPRSVRSFDDLVEHCALPLERELRKREHMSTVDVLRQHYNRPIAR